MQRKTKILLLGVSASMVLSGSLAAVLSAKHIFGAKQAAAAGTFVLDENTEITQQDGFYYGAALDSGNNTVNTKISGINYSSETLKVNSQSISYFTNLDPIRGMDRVSVTIGQGDGTVLGAFYFSYNPLNLDDIFAGKYQDLGYSMGQFYVSNGFEMYCDTNYVPTMGQARYVLGLVYNANESTSITFSSITYSTPCDKEPTKVGVGTFSDFRASEKKAITDAGLTAYVPFFFGNGSYMMQGVNYHSMDYEFLSLQNEISYNTLASNLFANGYDMTYTAQIGPTSYGFLFQKKVAEDDVRTVSIQLSLLGSTSYAFLTVDVTKSFPYMEPATSWPTTELENAGASAELLATFSALELTDATYQFATHQQYSGQDMFVVIITLDSGSLETNATEIQDYLDVYRNNASYEVEPGYDVGSYTITTTNGLYRMDLYKVSEITLEVMLYEKTTYDHLPVEVLATSKDNVLYPSQVLSATFYFDDGYYGYRTSNLTEQALLDYETALINSGYVLDGNPFNGVIEPGPSLMFTDKEFIAKIEIERLGETEFVLSLNSDTYVQDKAKLTEYLNAMSLYSFVDDELATFASSDANTAKYKTLRTTYNNFVYTSALGLPDGDEDDFENFLDIFRNNNFVVTLLGNGLYKAQSTLNSNKALYISHSLCADGLIIDLSYTYDAQNETFLSNTQAATNLKNNVLDSCGVNLTDLALPASFNYRVESTSLYVYGNYETVEDFLWNQGILPNHYEYNSFENIFYSYTDQLRVVIDYINVSETSLIQVRLTFESDNIGPEVTFVSYALSGISSINFISDNFAEIPHYIPGNHFKVMVNEADYVKIYISKEGFDYNIYIDRLNKLGFSNQQKVSGNYVYKFDYNNYTTYYSLEFYKEELLTLSGLETALGVDASKLDLLPELSSEWKYLKQNVFYQAIDFNIYNSSLDASGFLALAVAAGFENQGYYYTKTDATYVYRLTVDNNSDGSIEVSLRWSEKD